jgi:hypothetical protein
MRHRTHHVYDDFVTTSWSVSDARHNAMLGEYDHLALHAVADSATAATTVNIYLQHSSEGRQWLFRASNSTSTPATPEIVLVLANTTDVQHKMWSDACLGVTVTGPLLSFVRLQMQTVGGACHLKVHATLRGTHIR